MVVFKITIQCAVCGRECVYEKESGAFNGEIGKFECEHFKGAILVETKIGWLLGTNAEVNYHLHMKCLRCNEENIVTVSANGLDEKSGFQNSQYCHLPHFLKLSYVQKSIASGAKDFVGGYFNYFKDKITEFTGSK